MCSNSIDFIKSNNFKSSNSVSQFFFGLSLNNFYFLVSSVRNTVSSYGIKYCQNLLKFIKKVRQFKKMFYITFRLFVMGIFA